MSKSKGNNRFRSVGNKKLEEFENTSIGTRHMEGIVATSKIEIPIDELSFKNKLDTGKLFARDIIDELIPRALTKKVLATKSDEATTFSFFPSDAAPGITRKSKKSGFDISSLINPDRAVMKLIIGHDDRKPILESLYPYNTLCFLEIERDDTTDPIPATGFLISKRCIITAGHCVFAGKRWSKSAKIIPGAFGDKAPFGHAVSTTFRSVEGWTINKDANFDYGAIILNDDTLFNKVQATIGFKSFSEEKQVEIPGYPKDKNGFPWKCDGAITSATRYKLLYEIDTENGNSGSPIISSVNDKKFVVGLHMEGGTFNGGIRMRDGVLDRWGEWIKL